MGNAIADFGKKSLTFNPEDFGHRLKWAMREKNKTTEGLSRVIFSSKASVCNWANAKTMPNAESLALICAALDVSADYLLFGKG